MVSDRRLVWSTPIFQRNSVGGMTRPIKDIAHRQQKGQDNRCTPEGTDRPNPRSNLSLL